MLRLFILLLFTAVLSLHAHATNETAIHEPIETPSDSTRTTASSRLITFGMFTLKSTKKPVATEVRAKEEKEG